MREELRLAWSFIRAYPAYRRFVFPFHLSLLHGNFAFRGRELGSSSAKRIAHAARAISDRQLERLLAMGDWRGRLCAAWFIGLTRRSSFVDKIAELLLASELVFAGQGYCVALGLISGEICENHLRDYLKKYLPHRGRYYDRVWAVGALAHIRGTPPQEFLDPTLWVETTADQPEAGLQRFKKLVGYLQQHRMIAS